MTAKRIVKRFILSFISLTFISVSALVAMATLSPANASVAHVTAGSHSRTSAVPQVSSASDEGGPILYDPASGNLEVYVVGKNRAVYEKVVEPVARLVRLVRPRRHRDQQPRRRVQPGQREPGGLRGGEEPRGVREVVEPVAWLVRLVLTSAVP